MLATSECFRWDSQPLIDLIVVKVSLMQTGHQIWPFHLVLCTSMPASVAIASVGPMSKNPRCFLLHLVSFHLTSMTLSGTHQLPTFLANRTHTERPNKNTSMTCMILVCFCWLETSNDIDEFAWPIPVFSAARCLPFTGLHAIALTVTKWPLRVGLQG